MRRFVPATRIAGALLIWSASLLFTLDSASPPRDA